MLNGLAAPMPAVIKPEWLAEAIVFLAIVLAVVTIVLMLTRSRETGRRIADPLLIASAVAIVVLAIAAWAR